MAQDTESNIYSGGMLIVQPGYLMADNTFGSINTFSTGIGGILRFYLGKHFTAGILGGNTGGHYNTQGSETSYLKLGYGGAFAGYSLRKNDWRFTSAVSIGGGSVKNLHVNEQIGNKLNDAHYFKYATPVVIPFISVDRSLTKRLYLTAQISGIFFTENRVIHQNPVFQAGILFGR